MLKVFFEQLIAVEKKELVSTVGILYRKFTENITAESH